MMKAAYLIQKTCKSAGLVCRGDHVPCFPVIHRQRLFAVKKELLHMHGELIFPAHLLAKLSACRVRRCLAKR